MAIAHRLKLHLTAPQMSGRPVVPARPRRPEDIQPSSGLAETPRAPRRDRHHFDRLTARAAETRVVLDSAATRFGELAPGLEPGLVPGSSGLPAPYTHELQPRAVSRSPGVYALQMSPSSSSPSSPGATVDAQRRAIDPASVLATLGAGRPLPLSLRVQLAPRLAGLGYPVDLAAVRVHDGPEAAAACAELGAEAFAIGSHLAFAPGRFREDKEGLALIAHELTHVWQQMSSSVEPTVDPSPALERRAQAVEKAIREEGLAPQRAQKKPGVIDPDPDRAAKTEDLLRTLGDQLDLDTRRYPVRADEVARKRTSDMGRLGLMSRGEVYLDPGRYDPGEPEGKALLAHEVVHLAQAERRASGASGASQHAARLPGAVTTRVVEAEQEASMLASRFGAGQRIEAPTATLDAHVEAACGPREMAERPPKTEPTPGRGTTPQAVRVPPIYQIEKNQIQLPTINYEVDRDQITQTNPDARPIMRQLAETLRTYPEITKVRIEGFTSTTGSTEHNLALSQRRADNARAWLLSTERVSGVDMTAKGWGEEADRLKIKTSDDVENDTNRRTEVTIVEVDGRPAPPDWQPTRMKLVAQGRTIIRHLDDQGNLVREEVIADGAVAPDNSQGEAGAKRTGT